MESLKAAADSLSVIPIENYVRIWKKLPVDEFMEKVNSKFTAKVEQFLLSERK